MEALKNIFTNRTKEGVKSNKWLDTIFENAAVGIFIFNQEGRFRRSNQTFCKMLGYHEEELCQKTIFDILPRERWEWAQRKMGKIFSRDVTKVNFYEKLITKSRQKKWVEGYGSIVEDEDNQYILCFASDADEKAHTNEALKVSESGLRQAQIMAKMGSWCVDLNSQEIEWSYGMYEIMELPHDMKPTRDFVLSIIHPEDRPRFVKELIEDRKDVTGLEIRHNTKSGTKCMILNAALEVREGRPVRYHGTVQDVTETRIFDKHLQFAQRVAKMGWWECNLLTGVDTWSESCYTILGLEKGSVVPSFEAYKSTIHSEDLPKVMEMVDDPKVMKEGFHNREVRHIYKDGTIKYLLSSGHFNWDGDRPVQLVGTVIDITDLKETQTKLEYAQKIGNLGMWEADIETGITQFSDSIYTMMDIEKPSLGITFEQYLERLHPEDAASLADDVMKGKMADGWENRELRYRQKNGTYRYILSSGKTLYEGSRPIKMFGTNLDITSSKQVQLKLEKAQKIAKLGWWEFDLERGITQYSGPVYDTIDIDQSGMVTIDQYMEIFHPEDKARLMDDFNKGVLNKGWDNREFRYKRKGGGYQYVLSSGQVIFDGERPIKMVGTKLDITSSKEAQLKLEEAQKIAKMGWWEFDMTGEGNHSYSDEYLEITEIDRMEEALNFESYLSLVHPDDRPILIENQKRMIPNKGWNNLVHRIRRKEGGFKYVTSNASIEFQEDKPIRLLGSMYDVTDLKVIETELTKSEVNLKALITSMENLVFVIDDQMKFREVFCNDMSKIHYDPKDFLNKKITRIWNEYFAHGPELAKRCIESFETGKEDSMIYQFAPRDKMYWWEAHIRPFTGQDDRKRLAVFINDITTKKNAEEEMVKTIQKEKQLNEMSTQFVSMASHQFRTPLTVIKSNMQLLELSGIENPIIKKVSRRLTTEVDRLVNLMEDILAMGKVQSGTVKPKLKKVDMVTLVNKLKMNIERIQDDGRVLDVLVKGRKKTAKVDPQFMEHALMNLIDNAFKYSKGTQNPTLEIDYEKDKLHIRITDYGLGIPRQDRNRLFNSFQRGSNVQHISGTGLGLAVSKEFITLNGGTLFLDNSKETTFCIDLPLN